MSENTRKNRIAVAGTGYVGMSIATLLAQCCDVMAVDIVPEKVRMINSGISPIQDEYIERYLAQKALSLSATTDAALAYKGADFVVVAVPTNYDPEARYFDTSAVESVCREVRRVNSDAYIVIKSTIPIGYTARLRQETGDRRILFSPEFLRESQALYDNLYPARIIVGADMDDGECLKAARVFAEALRSGALKEDVETLFMGFTEAEAVKLFANTYLAMRVGFFNELDTYAEVKGLDARSIIDGVCLDSRIGGHYNNPSFGYGGYCFPKDTKQILANFGGTPQRLIRAVVETNDVRKEHIADMVEARLASAEKPMVGVYRLAMKSGSDNFRESAIVDVMGILRSRGISVVVYEPTVKDSYMGYTVEEDFDKFCQMSDIIIANRFDRQLESVRDKVYTRDIFGRN